MEVIAAPVGANSGFGSVSPFGMSKNDQRFFLGVPEAAITMTVRAAETFLA
jgi:hypothetical protein